MEYWVSLLGKQTQLPTLDIHISTRYSYHIWGNSDGQGCGPAQGPLRAILWIGCQPWTQAIQGLLGTWVACKCLSPWILMLKCKRQRRTQGIAHPGCLASCYLLTWTSNGSSGKLEALWSPPPGISLVFSPLGSPQPWRPKFVAPSLLLILRTLYLSGSGIKGGSACSSQFYSGWRTFLLFSFSSSPIPLDILFVFRHL